MPLGPDPERARAALARLDTLRTAVASGEDDVLACLVVTGEPRPQRVLDDWLDQVADTLRALGESVDRLAPPLARYAVPPDPLRVSSERAHGEVKGEEVGGGEVAPGDGARGAPASARGATGIRPENPSERAP